MEDLSLNPMILTTLQNAFLEKLSTAFSTVGSYALSVFYYIAVIELVLFGILWAIRQESLIGHMLIKLLKLSVIIFTITQYPYITQTIIDSFTLIAFQTTQPDAMEYLNNPGKLWEFGFDVSMSLLRISAHYGSLNVSLGNLYLILGLGTLLLFALIGTQILLVMIGFYWNALVGLFLLPFGAFTLLRNMFENTLRQLFIQAIRVATLIFVVGIGVNLWQKLHLETLTPADSLDKPLALIISALVIWILSRNLPSMTSAMVGTISSDLLKGGSYASASPSENISTQSTWGVSSANQIVAAASQITPNAYSASHTASLNTPLGHSPTTAQATTLSPSSFMGGIQGSSLGAGQAAALARSISKETVSKVQQSLRRNQHDDNKHG